MDRIQVGLGEGALGDEDEDRFAGDALVKQVEQAGDSRGGLAGAGWAGEEEALIDGPLHEFILVSR